MGGADAYIDHADVIGSTTMETDPAGGVQWKIAYYPWGQILAQGGIRQSVVWAGLDWQINDPSIPSATREYNDGLGRWLTPDPGGLAGAVESNPQTWNEYAYALNNPLRYTDTLGSSAQDRVERAYKLVMARVPYGGKNPCTGLDCSGFVQVVFQWDPDNTITALDTIQNAAMQFGDLLLGGQITTNLSQAQLGDAIFFKNVETGEIVHVGIALKITKSYIEFADEPQSGRKASFEVMNRAHTLWGKNEIFAGLGRPNEPAPGHSQLPQPPQPAFGGLLGGLANWLDKLFLDDTWQSVPSADHIHSNLCNVPNEPQCAQ